MPKNKRLMSGLLAVPLVTILLIAGCSVGSPEPTETPNPSPSISAPADPSATPAPSQTEEPPAPDVTAGATIDAETAAELNSTSKGQYRGYAMPDGSYIVVDRTAPLPEPVQADMNAKGNASQQFSSPEEGRSPANQAERQAITNLIAQQTGKTVIFVRRLPGFDYDGNAVVNYVPTGAGLGPDGTIRTRAEAEAVVAAKISSDPNAYAVVWPD